MSIAVTVQPELLRWARQRTGLNPYSLAQYLRLKDFSELQSWEQTGEIRLSQLEKIAKKAYVPVGYLFLEAPPADRLPIPDFRRQAGTVRKASPELIDTVNYCKFRQDWYEQKLIENLSSRLNFVNTANLDIRPDQVATSIKRVIDIDENTFSSMGTWEESLRLFVELVEAAGILVMRSGIVGNNTRRKLNVSEFRGFTINNDYSPLIFINSNDSKSAQMFTLAHEIVHVWLGKSGVSNLTFDKNNIIETFCNKVASELLVPTNTFNNNWNVNNDPLLESQRLGKIYKVSILVILIKAFQNGFIDQPIFEKLYDRVSEYSQYNKTTNSGGDFYLTEGVRLGRKFIGAVVSETLEGKTTYVEAFQLLGIRKSTTFNKLAGLVI